MLDTSAAYKRTVFDNIRPQAHISINISIIDSYAADDATVTAIGDEAFFSDTSQVQYDQVPEQTYATYEENRWRTDGSQLIPASPGGQYVYQGYVSQNISQEDGTYTKDTGIRVTFGSEHTFPAVTLVFDAGTGDYPSEVLVRAYRGGTLTKTVTGYPDNVMFAIFPEDRSQFENVDMVDILFINAGKRYRRARVQRFIAGYLINPDGHEIQNLTIGWDGDPIDRRLPDEALNFTLLNHDHVYNMDNPVGVWKDMQDRIPLTVSLGQTIRGGQTWGDVYKSYWSQINKTTWKNLYEGGGVEWLPLGTWYLDSQPKVRGRTAVFGATSIWGILDMEYSNGTWGPHTLYDLAVELLEFSNVPKLYDGSSPWVLDDVLKTFTTTAPLPVGTVRELLQYIACAAMCVMGTDREGHLFIKRLPTTVYDDYEIDFHGIIDLPDGEMSMDPAGARVECYSYTDIQEARDLVDTTQEVVAGETVKFFFNYPIQNVNVTLSDSGATYSVHAYTVDVTPSITGNMTTKITAQEARPVTYTIQDEVVDHRSTAKWLGFENPLIVTAAHARQVAAWAKAYIQLRTTYIEDYKGYPEIETYDSIQQQTLFSDLLPIYVLRNELSYNGALWGKLEAKRRDQ